LKEELPPLLLKLFHKIKKKEHYPTYSTKPGKHASKKILGQYPW
jgi:hypothetical protein